MTHSIYPVSPTTWSTWATWSPMGEQMCASGQRSRQRTCPSDSVRFCELECVYGESQIETDCCVGKMLLLY